MKKYHFIFCLFLTGLACSDPEVKNPDKETFNDPDWLKLEIPNGMGAYAVAGSIDGTLLVTTLTKAYYTVDQGKTWKESFDFHGPVPGLLERHDTIFSLVGQGVDQQGYPCASMPQYFTLDHGGSWKHNLSDLQLKRRIGRATTSSGTEYFLKANTTPVSPGANTFYVNPTDVVMKSATGDRNISFPYKHNMFNLHVDSDNRLYIAASGGTYEQETNTFYCCTNDMPAIVYVSKHPMP
jgi:hypothetical protein